MPSNDETTTVLILGSPMTVVEVPYDPDNVGIFQFPGKPEFFCALQKDIISSLSKDQTITLRNDLERILSDATHKEMELGFAEYAITPQSKMVVLCYFKERGVPQCS